MQPRGANIEVKTGQSESFDQWESTMQQISATKTVFLFFLISVYFSSMSKSLCDRDHGGADRVHERLHDSCLLLVSHSN